MSIFQYIAGLRPGRSAFRLSHAKIFAGHMGILYPVCVMECIPGDIFRIRKQSVVRANPLVAPTLHEMNEFTNYFFVPNRLLDDKWEEFITGGKDGMYTGGLPRLAVAEDGSESFLGKNTLDDFFGMPIGKPITERNNPIVYPWMAYNFIFNEYFRDQNLQEEVPLENRQLLRRAWKKDYFTSALPMLQRGIAPAMPIDINFTNPLSVNAVGPPTPNNQLYFATVGTTTSRPFITQGGTVSGPPAQALEVENPPNANRNEYRAVIPSNSLTIPVNLDLNLGGAQASSFDINDLRLAFQVQKWQERNMRAGVRLKEFLLSHFGVAPKDERLQRPEYIGGTKAPVIVSEVLQTSSTDTISPQGNLAGHGILIDRMKVGNYRVKEHGWIIGLWSIVPKPMYSAQGVHRSFTRRTRYDFYFPEFAHLSEQAVYAKELFSDGSEDDDAVFGFQGRYNELRVMHDQAVGEMRDIFNYWHLARTFDSHPLLNESFIKCEPDPRIFAVPSEPGFMVHYGNRIKAIRPMPRVPEPGFADHF